MDDQSCISAADVLNHLFRSSKFERGNADRWPLEPFQMVSAAENYNFRALGRCLADC
jgi:hypothetical protein